MICVIKGCRIQISFWFAAMIFFFIQLSTAARVSICAALCHEIGHIAMILFSGEKIRALRFSLIGAEIQRDNSMAGSKSQDIWISVSGPAVNIILAGILYIFRLPNAEEFLYANLALGVINLLPALPLDGGVIMYTIFSEKYSEEKAYTCAEKISFIVLTIVGSMGFLLLFRSPYNYSLLALAIYSMIYLANRNSARWKTYAKDSIRLHYE